MRALTPLLLFLPSLAWAATITSSTCTTSVTTGCVTVSLLTYPSAINAVSVQVSGVWSGTLVFEGSNGNTSSGGDMVYEPLRAFPVAGGSYTASTTGNGAWTVPTGGLLYLRVRASAWTSGSATVSPQPASSFVPPDVVRAVGPTFGAVQVSGTMDLSSATLASMGNYVCTVSRSPRVSLTTTATAIPAVPLTNRTAITLINVDGNKTIACERSISGSSPDCSAPGFGTTLFPNGGAMTIPVRESDTVKCIACVTGATLEYMEEACVAP